MPAGVDVTTVAVQTSGGPSYVRAQVNANGSFLLTGLQAGQYKVGFSQYPENQLASTWYGSYAETQATVVSVAAGVSVTGINQTMQLAGAISGKVIVPSGGVDASKITVFAGPEVGSYRTASASADGTFTVSGLEPGNLWVSFSYFESPSPVVSGYYSTSPDGSKTLVSVSEGATTTGINQTLKPAAVISGKISVPAGSAAFTGQVNAIKGPRLREQRLCGNRLSPKLEHRKLRHRWPRAGHLQDSVPSPERVGEHVAWRCLRKRLFAVGDSD